MKSRWIAAIAAASAVALLVVPLMLHSTRVESRTNDAPATPHKSEGVANLDLTFKDMHGGEVRLADYKGRVILVNVWATWCGPCELEIPELVEAYAKYKDKGVVILGVSLDDSAEGGAAAGDGGGGGGGDAAGASSVATEIVGGGAFALSIGSPSSTGVSVAPSRYGFGSPLDSAAVRLYERGPRPPRR